MRVYVNTLVLFALLVLLSVMSVTASPHAAREAFMKAHPRASGILKSAKHSSSSVLTVADGASWSIDMSHGLVDVSEDLWGIFFEEINHAGVAGLYNQQINNSNFEVGSLTSWAEPWYLRDIPSGMVAWIGLNQDFPLTAYSPYSIYVRSTGASGTVTLTNPGFWGINTIGVSTFTVGFWALAPAGFNSPSSVVVSVIQNSTGNAYGSVTINTPLTSSWQYFNATFSVAAGAQDPAAQFTISWQSSGTTVVYFDVVTLFPDNGWNGLPYIRPDLGEMVAQLHPSFMRFPGGCYVEGDVLKDRFNWKTNLGGLENRQGHWNLWGYWTEGGLGLFEYLSFIEKLTDVYGNPTRPIWVINSGNSFHQEVPSWKLGQYVQDALDSVEFIMGDVSTRYGSMRAAMGHPEPFDLKYLSIGNEGDWIPDWQHVYVSNYLVIFQALHAAYPQLELIANHDLTSMSVPTQMFDYHMYNSADWFFSNWHTFDAWTRKGAKVFNSEYAVTDFCGQGNMIAAQGEAAWMCGLERNSDLVIAAAYAPLFVNVNDRFWNPDAIVFDNHRAFGTPSYWTQHLFANSFWGTVAGTVQTLSSQVTNADYLFNSVTWGKLNATVATEKQATSVLIIKAVNPNATVVDALFTLDNVPSGMKFSALADVTIIAAANGTVENSFDAPMTVAPVDSTVTLQFDGSSFPYSFVPYSMTVLRVYF